MDPESRKALLTHCPAIFKALGEALRKASAQAGTDDKQKEQQVPATAGTDDASTKTKGNMTTARSSNMLKAKRLKPLLGCLSATVSAGTLKGMVSEVRDVKRALRAVAEACASLPMESLCNRAVGELDRVMQGEDGGGGKGKIQENGESLSPGAKRKAEGAVKPASASGDAGKAGGGKKKHKSHKSHKKKRGSLDV